MKKVFLIFVTLVVGMGLLSGCALNRALNQPDKKDFSVLDAGTHRDAVIAELGNPALSGKEGESEYDVFSFTQGYSKGAKAMRAFTHGVLGVATLGLWNLIGTPIEGIASGTKVRLKVTYDKNKKVSNVEDLEDN